MKTALLFLLIILSGLLQSQEVPANVEQQMEQLADITETETEDDGLLVGLEQLLKDPVNLNQADEHELSALPMLNVIQVSNLLAYRKLFGLLVSIYELQAVPSWDIVTIRRILPYIKVTIPVTVRSVAGERFRDGEHNFIFRVSRGLESAKGYKEGDNGKVYPGSRDRIYFRYRYNFRNLLQFGAVGDKDAGERFFAGSQKPGFDFYSLHLFMRKMGVIQALALGDFTVNMGQGLIQWQTMAFKKSAEISGIRRQSTVLRPYNSPGEFNFQRGAGLTLKKERFEVTLFASLRKLSANFSSDSVRLSVSSFLPMGYHRTETENRNRNNLSQFAAGGNITYRNNRFNAGLNAVHYAFSVPLQKRDEPYNYFSISGRTWNNLSIDYNYTYRNLHVFGEVATCNNLSVAMLNGLLISPGAQVDISVVHRLISPRYQTLYGNAFTENSLPVNESGLFAGLDCRLPGGLRISGYADLFHFPWLRFGMNGPSRGLEYLLQVHYQPNRKVDVYTRYRMESKQRNVLETNMPVAGLVLVPRRGWRTHLGCQLSADITVRTRAEFVWYDNKGSGDASGSLFFADLLYKPKLKPYAGALRLEYFETEDYNARIYAYEQDIAYSFSIPAMSGKGHRYYVSLNYDPAPRWTAWLRFACTIYSDRTVIGSGNDEIAGNRKSEIRFQLRWIIPAK